MDYVAIVTSILCLIGTSLITTAFILDLKAQNHSYLLVSCILSISLSDLSFLLSFLALFVKRWKPTLHVCHVTLSFSVGIKIFPEATRHLLYTGHHTIQYLLIAGSVLHFICSILVMLYLHYNFRKFIVTSKHKNYTGLSRAASESYETLVQERQSFVSGSNVYESVSINPPPRQAVYGSNEGFDIFEEEDIYVNDTVQER